MNWVWTILARVQSLFQWAWNGVKAGASSAWDMAKEWFYTLLRWGQQIGDYLIPDSWVNYIEGYNWTAIEEILELGFWLFPMTAVLVIVGTRWTIYFVVLTIRWVLKLIPTIS